MRRRRRSARPLRDDPSRLGPSIPQLPHIPKRVHPVSRRDTSEQIREMRVLLVRARRTAVAGRGWRAGLLRWGRKRGGEVLRLRVLVVRRWQVEVDAVLLGRGCWRRRLERRRRLLRRCERVVRAVYG